MSDEQYDARPSVSDTISLQEIDERMRLQRRQADRIAQHGSQLNDRTFFDLLSLTEGTAFTETVNEHICTYSQGYVDQPVYACLTCHPKHEGLQVRSCRPFLYRAKEGSRSSFCPQAGICVGCSMECHLHHDIVELFNKRSFRYEQFLALLGVRG